MIAVTLDGRLGNQLFQYAFIYAAARMLNTQFYIDKRKEPYLLPEYFNIEPDILYPYDSWLSPVQPYGSVTKKVLKELFYKLVQKRYLSSELIFSNAISPAEQVSWIKNKTLFKGFFQSEEYFINYKDEVTKMLQVKEQYTSAYQSIRASFPTESKIVCVHIRRGDFVGLNLNLPSQYYHQAIKSLHSDFNFYVIISDDYEFARNEFYYLENKYISKNPEIIDFQFLMNADYCILSNSSFSWWGGYLNIKAEKVIAPGNWTGFKEKAEYPKGIMTDKFIWSGVN